MNLPGGLSIDFTGTALIMAVINCNDNSFYPESRNTIQTAVENALLAEEAGAAIIDFGGESSRPGSEYIDAGEELSRVIPAIESFRKKSCLPISIDTRKSEVARAALDAGADIINDISALKDEKMAPLCAERGAPVVLMHMKGVPSNMQESVFYHDVFAEVKTFLLAAAEKAISAGISVENIILDPGFGFGKNTSDNLVLLARLAEMKMTGYPLLAGLSRKSFIGELTGRSVNDRLAGTLAANAIAVNSGVNILRVHDVKENADLIKIFSAVKKIRLQE